MRPPPCIKSGSTWPTPQIGPVAINLQRFFRDMPIRYTLRSTRPEGGVEGAEEESFVTIAFKSELIWVRPVTEGL
jgi:hypothetical protein